MKTMRSLIILFLIMVLSTVPNQNIYGAEKGTEISVKDDFYEAINGEWISEAVIKEGYVKTSNFTEITDETHSKMMKLFKEIVEQKNQFEAGDERLAMIHLYENYINKEKRESEGFKPIAKYLKYVEEVTSVEDYTKLLLNKDMIHFNPLYQIGIMPDMKDSTKRVVMIGSGNLQLGDADNYRTSSEYVKLRKNARTEYLESLLKAIGVPQKDATKSIEKVYEFEKKLAKHIMGIKQITEKSNIYDEIYNPYTIEELNKIAPKIPFDEVLKMYGYENVEYVIVQEPKWLETLNKFYTEENIEVIKWATVFNILTGTAKYLSPEFEEMAKMYSAKLNGTKGTIPKEQEAFEIVNRLFSNTLGKAYVEKYFSEEEKNDVNELVDKILTNYYERIEKIEWLSESTKNKALQKIENMNVKMGYPDKWNDYEGIYFKSADEGGSVVGNLLDYQMFALNKDREKLYEPVDKKEFQMAPQTVNACYSPLNNDITFPAAILQGKIYDKNRKIEENMGAIGVIIAHEITHAIDNNGSKFDEKGNLFDWWTKSDYKKFKQRADNVVKYYDKIELMPGEFVNGELTLGENIADIGAMACMLEIMETLPNPDYKAFFESWATVWRMKATDAHTKQLLQSDPHSPAKVRVNEVVKQFEKFYETYDIEKEDAMYVEPEKRLEVW
ncbi:MAG: M13 family metallopeptidase [Cellulosilyticaceae bacterium]